MKTKQITLSPHSNKLLDELVKKREDDGSIIKFRQGVCADAILQLHQKEIKK